MKSDICTQYKRNNNFLLYLGMAAGAAVAIWVWRRLSSPRPAPELETWQRILAGNHGADEAARIAKRVQSGYEELMAESPPESNLALRWHLTSNILPGLALFRALLEEHQNNREAALAEVESCFRAEVEQQFKAMRNHSPLPSLSAVRRLSAAALNFAISATAVPISNCLVSSFLSFFSFQRSPLERLLPRSGVTHCRAGGLL